MMDFNPSRRVNPTNSSGRGTQLDSLLISPAHVKPMPFDIPMNSVLMKWVKRPGKDPDHDFGTRPQFNSSSALLSADYQGALDLQRNMSRQSQHLGSDVHVERISQFNSSRSQSDGQRQTFSAMSHTDIYNSQLAETETHLDVLTNRFLDVRNSGLEQGNGLLGTQRMRSSQVWEGDTNEWQGSSRDQQWGRELNNSVDMSMNQQWGRQPNVSVDMDRDQQWDREPNGSVDMDRDQQWDGSGEYTETVDSQRQYFGDVRDSMDSGREQFDYTDGVSSSSWGQIRSLETERGLQTGVLPGDRDYSLDSMFNRNGQNDYKFSGRDYDNSRSKDYVARTSIRNDYCMATRDYNMAIKDDNGSMSYTTSFDQTGEYFPENTTNRFPGMDEVWSTVRRPQTSTAATAGWRSEHRRSPVRSSDQRSPPYSSSRRSAAARRSPQRSIYRRSPKRHRSPLRPTERSQSDLGARSRYSERSRSPMRSRGHRSPTKSTDRSSVQRSSHQRDDKTYSSKRGNTSSFRKTDTGLHSREMASESLENEPKKQVPEPKQLEPPIPVTFVKDMMCPACPDSARHFETYDVFNNHWKRVHSKFKLWFSCPVHLCFESYPSRSKLIGHIRKEHSTGEKLSQDLETFLKEEIKASRVECKPQIDPGNLIFDFDEEEQNVKSSRYNLSRDAAVVHCLLTTGTRPSMQSRYKKQQKQQAYPYFSGPQKGRTSNVMIDLNQHKIKTTHVSEQTASSGWRSEHRPPVRSADRSQSSSSGQRSPPKSSDRSSSPCSSVGDSCEEIMEMEKEKTVCIVFQPGMRCPVCPKSKKNQILNDFRSHWYAFHTKLLDKYFCPHIDCCFVAGTNTKLRKHYKNVHNNGNDLSDKDMLMVKSIKAQKVHNTDFVDPGYFKFDLENRCEKPEEEKGGCVVFQSGMTCPVCRTSKKYLVENGFKVHWKRRHIKFFDTFACPFDGCITKTQSHKHLRKHYRTFHTYNIELSEAEMSMVNGLKPLRVDVVAYVDPGNWTYETGVPNLTQQVEDPDKPVPIEFQPNMKCPICWKTRNFQKVFDFRNHWLLCHIRFNPRYPCPFENCCKALASVMKLVKHYKRFHNDDEEPNEETMLMLNQVKAENVKNDNFRDPGKFTFDYDSEDIRQQKFDHTEAMQQLADIRQQEIDQTEAVDQTADISQQKFDQTEAVDQTMDMV